MRFLLLLAAVALLTGPAAAGRLAVIEELGEDPELERPSAEVPLPRGPRAIPLGECVATSSGGASVSTSCTDRPSTTG